MNQHPLIYVHRADWATDSVIISAIRRRVFVEEQRVPEPLEWDGLDSDAFHVLGRLDGRPVATGRLLRSGQIGRMAVLPNARGLGIGGAVLGELVALAREHGLPRVFLHAQIRALTFYRRHGFAVSGPVFTEAGIRHRIMVRNLLPER